METPWYRDGLRFECTQCGNCCTGAPGFVWVSDEEVGALAEFLGVSPAQAHEMYTRRYGARRSLREKANGDCVFYDRQAGCTVYAVRPRQCRTWPFWESNLAPRRTGRRLVRRVPAAAKATSLRRRKSRAA